MTAPVASREEARYQELARRARLPYVSLEPAHGSDAVNHDVARQLPEPVCRTNRMLAVAAPGRAVTLAVADPFDSAALGEAGAILGRPVRSVVSPPSEIEAAIDRVFGRRDGGEGQARGGASVPLGEVLVERGAVSREDVDAALAQQRRSGNRIGEILHHAGLVRAGELAEALGQQLRIPALELSALQPDPRAVELLPETFCRQRRIVPLAVDNRQLTVVTAEPLGEEALALLADRTDLRIRSYLAPPSEIDRLLQRLHGHEYVQIARAELLRRYPEDCANRVLTSPQQLFLGALALIVLAGFALAPLATGIALVIACTAIYAGASLYKFKLIYDSFGRRREIVVPPEELAALDERELPVYTVLVPLYREAEVVERLVEHIEALDYPKAKLDVRLLVEEDDTETRETIERLDLLPHFKLVVVPDAQPKTKPKACNYGLLQAEGEFVVIYDAEDRPDPDQLKKAVAAFRRVDARVVCVQCKLNYFNQDQNLLTRFFSAEYSMWFDLLLPGLDAAGAPIPLGGTSNHFRLEALVELGGWDPFNVTEDADLGIRLHKVGYETTVLDSTTLEEANSELGNWIRQRSRWIKGYIQTYLVHMRHPLRLLSQSGVSGFLSFQAMVGGTVVFLLNPIFWTLTTLWLFSEASVIDELFPGFLYYAAAFLLFIGNFTFIYLNVAGAVQRRYFDLAKYALISPIYWFLMSIGAWRGFIQLFTKPFYWEKTVHGLDVAGVPPPPAPRPAAAPDARR